MLERLSGCFFGLGGGIYPLIVISLVFNPWLVEELGAWDAHYMVAFAGSMLLALILAPSVGAVADRIGRRPVLVVTTIVAVAGFTLLGLGSFLGLSDDRVLLVALLFFVASNVGFQAGVAAHGGWLSADARKGSPGRTNGLEILVGYIGSAVALVVMFVGLQVLGSGEPLFFVTAGALYLLFAVPALWSLNDPPAPGRPLVAMDGPFWSAWDAVRRVRGDRVLSRFLLIRSVYAGATVTLILVIGVYAVTEVGFDRGASAYYTLGGVATAAGLLLVPLWGALVERIGPRHTLMVALSGCSFLLAIVVVHPLLGLPQTVFYLIGGLLGVFLAGVWRSDRSLSVALIPQDRVGGRSGVYALTGGVAAVIVPVAWVLLVDVLFVGSPGARQVGVLSILLFMLSAAFLLRSLPDPVVVGRSPLARFLPWGDGSGRSLARAWRLPLRAPFTLLYLAVTWFVFFVVLSPQPHPDPGTVLYVPSHQVEGFYLRLPDLVEAPHKALLSVLTAPLVNVHFVQLVYVTVLLLLFGLVLEVREGPLRTVLVFLATSVFASLVAGLLHIAVYPGVIDHPILERAEITVWTGGSAGAFGIMGATAARARTGWPLLVLFAVWELNVGFWFLRSYTPAFHLSALAGGFLLMRFGVPYKAPPGTRRHVETSVVRRPLAPPRGVPPEEP